MPKEPEEPSSAPNLLQNPWANGLVRLSAAVAAGLCGWLVWLKASGQISSVAGCGGGGGCQEVLGGRWASWFGIPVSLLACLFYLGVLLLTIRKVQHWLGTQADRLLCAAALVAIFCAFWFISLLAKEGQFCPYCFTAHILGAGFSIPVLWGAWKMRHREGLGFMAASVSTAAIAIVALVAGQLLGPKPSTVKITQGNARSHSGFVYDPQVLPHLGNPTAPHQIVEYFDYTCGGCRDMHGDLKALMKLYPGKFLLIQLPCPLSRQCNRHLRPEVEEHQNACDYAKLSLAVWRKTPTEWPAFHDHLIGCAASKDLEGATRTAWGLLGGPDQTKTALADPWIHERLSETTHQYKHFCQDNIKMPKLLLGDNHVMHGVNLVSTESFIQDVRRILRL